MRLLSVLLHGTLPLEPVWYFCSYELLESPKRGRKKKKEKAWKGKQKHILGYTASIALPCYLLLLMSSNGMCRLISHPEQRAGLMDQPWRMCSCASLVSRCVSLFLLPHCPSKPSFVSIVVLTSIRHAKNGNHNILHCGSVCLMSSPSSWPPLPLAGRGFVLPSQGRRSVFCWNQAFLTHVPVEVQNGGLYLEAFILFSYLISKCIVPLILFLMIFNLWRDPGP